MEETGYLDQVPDFLVTAGTGSASTTDDFDEDMTQDAIYPSQQQQQQQQQQDEQEFSTTTTTTTSDASLNSILLEDPMFLVPDDTLVGIIDNLLDQTFGPPSPIIIGNTALTLQQQEQQQNEAETLLTYLQRQPDFNLDVWRKNWFPLGGVEASYLTGSQKDKVVLWKLKRCTTPVLLRRVFFRPPNLPTTQLLGDLFKELSLLASDVCKAERVRGQSATKVRANFAYKPFTVAAKHMVLDFFTFRTVSEVADLYELTQHLRHIPRNIFSFRPHLDDVLEQKMKFASRHDAFLAFVRRFFLPVIDSWTFTPLVAQTEERSEPVATTATDLPAPFMSGSGGKKNKKKLTTKKMESRDAPPMLFQPYPS